jgi:preprotein translocase subunit SecG
MWFRIISVTLILILLSISLLTHNWQILRLSPELHPKIETSIGLWKTCIHNKSDSSQSGCQGTKTDDNHRLFLILTRLLSILTIIFLVIVLFLPLLRSTKPKICTGLIGIAVACACIVPFIYSTRLENYFSQGFDKLMVSKYGYSFYLQGLAALLLITLLIFHCTHS